MRIYSTTEIICIVFCFSYGSDDYNSIILEQNEKRYELILREVVLIVFIIISLVSLLILLNMKSTWLFE